MSKNFELLQRVAKQHHFDLPGMPAQPRPKALAEIQFKKQPHDPEIAKLVHRLFAAPDKTGTARVVGFSGITREDRSTWICARAGEILAEREDIAVCIVDANLWSPRLHMHLAATNQAGLAEALTDAAPIRNFAVPLNRPNFWMITSGMMKPGFYPSLERCRERFAEMRRSFDYILVSAPAFSREAEATFVGQLSDGVVLVVEANQTRRDAVLRAKEQLEGAKVQLLGAVLDQRSYPIPEKIYRKL